jgi:hypothetical protein
LKRASRADGQHTGSQNARAIIAKAQIFAEARFFA